MWPIILWSLVSRDPAVLEQEPGPVSMSSFSTFICMQGCLALLENFFLVYLSCALGRSSWLDCLFCYSEKPREEFGTTSWSFHYDPSKRWQETAPRKKKNKAQTIRQPEPYFYHAENNSLLYLCLVRGNRDQDKAEDTWKGQRNGKQHQINLNA